MSATRQQIEQGDVVWTPPADILSASRVGEFLAWVARERDLEMTTHDELWTWSVTDLDGFWSAVWEFFGVRAHAPYEAVLASRDMPGARWFPGALLNYAEHALGTDADLDRVAVLGRSQTRDDVELTFGDLRDQVARARAALARLGVRRGDRVAGYLPNIPEALVAYLATASLGATWASCASEFGPRSVIDRFAQIEPVVLLVAGGYRYGAKDIDRRSQVAEILAELPSVRHVVDVEYGQHRVEDALSWPSLLAAEEAAELAFEPVPFDHPLVVLFSSGTTGRPKAIVHGHGGILLEHLKNHALSWDMGPEDRMLWFSTTAWMMWNALVSSLLVRSSIVMVDGNPMHPDLTWQWRLAASTGATVMGASPGFVMACRKDGVDLKDLGDLRVRVLGSAGAPLPPEGYAWLSEQLPGTQINVGSGGTDVCSGIVQNNPLLPVYAGEISGRCLGVDAHAYNESGRPVIGELGELVITSPMPSMPVGFWGDEDGSRYRDAYFDHYPGVWRHGDWILFHDNGSCHVAGRSDATLNRGGVRLGTAEFYRVAEEVDGVADSLVVHLEDPDGGNGELLLFVVTDEGTRLDDPLRARLVRALRSALSPRHIPDQVIEVPAVPRNLTGKKLELPAKRILQGARLEEVASRDALADPSSLDPFVALATSGALSRRTA
ncbi:acetoacetate--CoA ligase [Nocardioides albus]|uniref:Acetoacetyl-CoA synthetase n=1 Tax=Nocardioides albus TaxID=1841 RepID=A0A7W5A799_9ACTN|nr:acetoacetate--CoA ligase [Nocardioides albus]MBB3090524.1 acetoacetyl-CoA synthetase [Nocardioides albus]GGU24509.1 acetoacetyl-CoA synthetase [Nocardioides albus]